MEQNNVEWLKWVHMNYIESEWKTCRVCGEQYPATEKFFYKQNNTKDGLRDDCITCHKIYKQESYTMVKKVAENTSPNGIGEGINNYGNKTSRKHVPQQYK
ncbi:MAG: hypothetical protein FD169_1312 [Bacillota bacterium]|nr:MAG: hypothetical protein FD169_1312 [Bacillota bacterium]